MMFLNMYENTDNGEDEEYVESLPESYSEEDLKAMEEAKKQKEEQLKVWKEKMQQNAMMFLSDTGVIVRHRKRREVVDNFWRKHHKLMNSRIGLIINDFTMIENDCMLITIRCISYESYDMINLSLEFAETPNIIMMIFILRMIQD